MRLGDVCEVVSGSTPKTSVPDYWDGTIKWVTPSDIDGASHIVFDTKKHLTEAGLKSANLSLMPVGTVLLTTRAPIGKVAIAGSEMCCNQGFKNLICSEEVDSEFLFRLLKYRARELQALGRGATFKELSKRDVENFKIALPPLESQHAAASKLLRVEEVIAAHKIQLSLLDTLVKSRFIEMFGDPTTPHGSWEYKQLGEICRIVTGNTPSRKRPEYYGDNIEWIKTDNITGNTYLSEASESLSEQGLHVGRSAPAGSILMACIAGSIQSIGKVAIADRPVAFNQQINALIPSKTVQTPYLFWALRLSKDHLCSNVNIQLKGILNKTTLSKKTYSLPPLPLQREFAAFVAGVAKLEFDTPRAAALLERLLAKLRAHTQQQ